MKKAFQLCESCNLQPSCPTGVALDSSECGKEIEIRTCKAYVQVKTDNPTIIESEEGEKIKSEFLQNWHEEGE